MAVFVRKFLTLLFTSAVFLSVSAQSATTLDTLLQGRTSPPFPITDWIKLIGGPNASGLVPFGLSGQAYATNNEFPRLVLGFEGVGTSSPFSRVYIGYASKADEQIHAMVCPNYSPECDFFVATDYATNKTAKLVQVDRKSCVACHQGGTPILPSGLKGFVSLNQVPNAEPIMKSAVYSTDEQEGYIFDWVTADASRLKMARAVLRGCQGNLECRRYLTLKSLLPFGESPPSQLESKARFIMEPIFKKSMLTKDVAIPGVFFDPDHESPSSARPLEPLQASDLFKEITDSAKQYFDAPKTVLTLASKILKQKGIEALDQALAQPDLLKAIGTEGIPQWNSVEALLKTL